MATKLIECEKHGQKQVRVNRRTKKRNAICEKCSPKIKKVRKGR